MGSRLKLQSELEEILGSKNVYYQPPNNLTMSYPCIRYALEGYDVSKADDVTYKNIKRYEVIVISKTVDHPAVEKILQMSMCSFDRQYISENLYHYVLTLYF